MAIRHLLLDRDGVLNREDPAGGWVIDPADWRWERGALDGLRLLAAAGMRISVVTNQSCLGRGLATPAAIAAVHDRMLREAAAAGAAIHGVFVCPHAPRDRCGCRKPRPGLIRRAVAASRLPRTATLLVGDAREDLEAGRRGGVAVALVRTGKGAATEEGLDPAIPVYADLWAAAAALLAAPPEAGHTRDGARLPDPRAERGSELPRSGPG